MCAEYVKVGGEYLDRDQHYKLATKSSLAGGEEGYSGLGAGTLLTDSNTAPNLTTAVINHFAAVAGRKAGSGAVHHQPLLARAAGKANAKEREDIACRLKPRLEGRILQLTEKVRRLMIHEFVILLHLWFVLHLYSVQHKHSLTFPPSFS